MTRRRWAPWVFVPFAASLVVGGAGAAGQTAIAPSSVPAPSTGLFAQALRAYHAALLARHLGQTDLTREDVGARVAEAEELLANGRVDDAVARLAEMIEHPRFDLFADSDEGRAAVFRLGDGLASAGIFEAARSYLRRLVEAREAWSPPGTAQTWARRAVRRLADIALETYEYATASGDLKPVPADAPEEVLGEVFYMTGRAEEAAGNQDAALSAYGKVTQRSRFWAAATYLAALIHVEKGRYREGESLLCKVADPKRSAKTTPVFADEKFFAIRDLARLGLGRIAHEQGRNDDARYYYYLVPQDSDRLADALYEAATTRYEKKDYEGARQLLDELNAFGAHHRYEDEAWVLSAWVDLARCRFADADKTLVEFLSRYQPVRDGAKRIADSDTATQHLLAAVHTGADAAGVEIGGVGVDATRTIAALVRIDPAYDRILRRRAVLEREASGLVATTAVVTGLQRALATNGGVRPTARSGSDRAARLLAVRASASGVERQLIELEAKGLAKDVTTPFRRDFARIQDELVRGDADPAQSDSAGVAVGADLPDLLRADAAQVMTLEARIAAVRKDLSAVEAALAKDALHRLDTRLSRLLRRARLGRIESVLGRKRALQVEVEAIKLGYLPSDAVDSLDAPRYLEDGEEYWPFEGDDWPDEYVGSEVK